MRRVDLLKMQLLNSRGRFFTVSWKGRIYPTLKENIKVTSIVEETAEDLIVRAYVPRLARHVTIYFPINGKGDCTYIASDKSKFQMSGQQAFNF